VYEGKSEQELVTSMARNATLDECRKLMSEDVVSGLQVQPVQTVFRSIHCLTCSDLLLSLSPLASHLQGGDGIGPA
jgi:hypothetical protein